MKRLLVSFLLFLALSYYLNAQPTIYTVGTSSFDFQTLQQAFDYINLGAVSGDIELQIIDNTIETGTCVLNSSGGGVNYSSILIYPITSGLSISGGVNGPLIDLNGADHVTFDGRVNQTGPADLIITNANTGALASTFRFIESTNTSVVKYCIIKGSETSASSGIIIFSTASSGTGNDGNIIDNNYITSDVAGRPVNVVYSSGSSGRENSGNIISNNKIYDFLKHGTASNGIHLSSFSTSFSITDNSFYETTSFIPTAIVSYNAIQISNTGTGFIITGNFIGGQDVGCGGSAWIKTNASNNIFVAINLSVGTGTGSSIQNNTISNINWSNSSNAQWTGIQITAGDLNVGTITGNTIGATSGTGSVLITEGSTAANVYGIYISSTGMVDCQKNNIGSITAANSTSTNGTNFYGINKTATGGTTTISNNIIGSTSTISSINASSLCGPSSLNSQVVYGIFNAGTGTITINGNTIANMVNSMNNSSATRPGLINGIASIAGTNTVSNNIIRDLTIANANSSQTQVASVCGIALTGTLLPKTVSGNTIFNLSNTFSTFAGYVIGIYFSGNIGTNSVSGNFIHSLTVSSSAGFVAGIKILTGLTTYYNNIISLGGNTATTIYGIYETGAAGNNNNLYFNSIYISGTPTSGAKNSSGIYCFTTTNTKDIRNNVIYNSRSNSGATGSHFALYIINSAGTMTCDYNDYYVSGTGGILGYYGSNMMALPIVTGQDANSFAIDPVYTAPGSTTASDYTIGEDLIGISGTGVTTDFGAATRNNPTMGAWERIVNKWKGTNSTSWNSAANWTASVVPLENSNIIFDNSPVNNLSLNANHSVNNITIVSANNLVTNGNQLTIKGTVSVSNGGKIDATSSSAVVYAGTAAQTLDGAGYLSGKAYNMIIDNTAGVTLNSDFTIDNNFTINSGKLFTISAGRQLNVTGALTNSSGISGLVIKSDANGNDGKLINNTASVPATVELFLSGGLISPTVGIFHYFVPPVASMNIGTSVALAKTNLGLTNFDGDLISYSEVAAGSNKNNGWQYFDGYNGTIAFSSIASSAGYNIYLTAGDKITFKGLLNGPSHTFSNLSFTNLGWNLIGNPYPCNYDLNGITELTTNGDNVDNTIVFNNNGGYAYWNVETGAGTTGYSDIIPPMQGFFVHVTATGKSLNLPVGFKSSSVAGPMRSKSDNYSDVKASYTEIKKIKLVLNNGPLPDETIVCLLDKATTGYDGDYDAPKFFDTPRSLKESQIPSIYTEMNSVQYAINSVSVPEKTSVTRIPVRIIIKTPGTYRIDITEFENLDDLPVLLRHGAIETILNKDASYTFTSAAGTFTDFELIIGYTNSIPSIEKITDPKFKVWYSKEYLYINCPDVDLANKGMLVLYDIQGKTVYSDDINYFAPGQTIQVPLTLPIGVYITRIIINQKLFTSKIVVY